MHEKKSKSELWKMIEELQEQISLLQQFLREKNLYSEAEKYVQQRLDEKEELPFN